MRTPPPKHDGPLACGPVELPSPGEGYRAELLKLFGAEPGDAFLHGKTRDGWVHVPPLGARVTAAMLEPLCALVAQTPTKRVTVLAADFAGVTPAERERLALESGVRLVLRWVTTCALSAVARALSPVQMPEPPDTPRPHFYAELAVGLSVSVDADRVATIELTSCEVDEEAFLVSQRPPLALLRSRMTQGARAIAKAASAEWEAREPTLRRWLAGPDVWMRFVDTVDVDWDFGKQTDGAGAPLFISRWKSFRAGKGSAEITFTTKVRYAAPGTYQVAAQVIDIFGNEGRAIVLIDVP